MVDLPPKVVRTDAIQSFVTQEPPLVTVTTDDGASGTGYSNAIGTGGSSVMAPLHDHLAPQLIGRDPAMVEQIWKDLLIHPMPRRSARSPHWPWPSTRPYGICAAGSPGNGER